MFVRCRVVDDAYCGAVVRGADRTERDNLAARLAYLVLRQTKSGKQLNIVRLLTHVMVAQRWLRRGVHHRISSQYTVTHVVHRLPSPQVEHSHVCLKAMSCSFLRVNRAVCFVQYHGVMWWCSIVPRHSATELRPIFYSEFLLQSAAVVCCVSLTTSVRNIFHQG